MNHRDPLWLNKYGTSGEKIDYVPDDGHGVHMPSQSWFPLVTGLGMLIMGISLSLHAGGIPFMGYLGIGGICVVTIGVYLWLFEGPGGYHLHPESDPEPEKP